MAASICSQGFSSPRAEPLLHCTNTRFLSANSSKSTFQPGILIPRVDSSFCCRCDLGSGGDLEPSSQESGRWEYGIHDTFRGAVKRIEDYIRSFTNPRVDRSLPGPMEVEVDGELEENEWDWDRWMKHFVEIDEQERILTILKSELDGAVSKEDYEAAARLKVAIAAAAAPHDTVGRALSHMKKYVEGEQYSDAARMRDCSGAGLVGWWAGVSDNPDDPYGCVIHISAEHGRYIARNYTPRQLAMDNTGARLFEVYLRENKNGEYKQKAVYLKRKEAFRDTYSASFQPLGSSRNSETLDSRDSTSTPSGISSEDTQDSEDRSDDLGFEPILPSAFPVMKVNVVRVTAPGKVDQDNIISKAIEQIMHEEDEFDSDIDIFESDGESADETSEEYTDIELESSSGLTEEDEQNLITVKVVVDDVFLRRPSDDSHADELIRVPARLERKGHLSFTFNVEKDENENLPTDDPQFTKTKTPKIPGKHSIDFVLLELVKSIGKGKVPLKVLKDVGELVNLTLSQARNHQPLSGSTTFHRIDISSSADPLNGVYIGAHGLHASEVIVMKRRFGQFKQDGNSKKPSKLEFYEYVEAVKVTGDAYVPAGQVAFRAKIGKQYQLPHKGIIPEEFGVIARYRGQGRLAEPGFHNPRWVDGELVILDGKYIKGGPVIGFIYWDPKYHFLTFFNRLVLGN